jgi:DNA repair exonuclease SbcCD nuclease subunit
MGVQAQHRHTRSRKCLTRVNVLVLTILLTGTPLLSQSQVAPDANRTLRVGIIGDQTGSSNLSNSYGILRKGVQILSKEEVQVVLHVGDLLESTEAEADYHARFNEAVKILDKVKPWFVTVGDHDISPPKFEPGSADRTREGWFKKLYGEKVQQAKDTLYYSFDIEGYHFVALNSQETLHADPRWGDTFLARLSRTQLDWLAKDLEQHRSARGIVVFLHQPLWYNWSGWMQVHQLLRKYPIAAIIAGHFHYNQDEGELDGVRYIVVGATGGNVKSGHRGAGDVHHVTVMTLNGRQAVFELLPVNTPGNLRFTPRRDMDRVQALDQLLGGFLDFGQKNNIFIKGDQLIASCEKNTPAFIRFTSLGNPIDVPMKLRIDFLSDKMTHVPSFAEGLCVEIIDGQECVLNPGKRVAIANTSTVSTSFCDLCQGNPGSVWEAQLGLVQNAKVTAGYPIRFNVRLSFQGETEDQGKKEELYLERQVSTELQACPA